MPDPNPLKETTDRARTMLEMRLSSARESLVIQRKRNPLLDVLPPGMTLKRFSEVLKGIRQS